MNGFTFISLVLTVGSSIWVWYDSSNLLSKLPDKDLRKISGPKSPTGWVTGCVLLWIVFFPWYLANRSKYKVASPAPSQTSAVTGPRQCPSCGKYFEGNPAFCPNCGFDQSKVAPQNAKDLAKGILADPGKALAVDVRYAASTLSKYPDDEEARALVVRLAALPEGGPGHH